MSQNDDTGPGTQSKAPGSRPGAMTMAMQAVNLKPHGPRVLRIGVIQGGKIVEERIIRKRETVTVGSSERNHFVLNAPGVASRFELFQLVGSDYILNFSESMSGRVGLPAGVQTLEQLRNSGAARHAGTHWQVKLSDSSRGKVIVGDVTLLFQFLTPAPVQPRPQLPAAARGGLAKSMDWVFTAFVLFSFLGHFGLVVYLENTDWPIEQDMSVMTKRYFDLIMPEEREPDDAPVIADPRAEETVADTTPAPSEPAEKPRGESSQGKQGEPKVTDVETGKASDRIAKEAANAAETMLLGALSAEGGGSLANVLADGAVTGNAADILAQAEGVGVASGAAGAVKIRNGSGTSGMVSGLGTLTAHGGGDTIGDGKKIDTEGPIRGTFKPLPVDAIGGSGDFDPKLVIAMIRQRQDAIKACYEHRLRVNPSLEGKVAVEFTIEESGLVSKPSVTENSSNDSELASCVIGVLKRFRFTPGPEGGSVMFSFPFVFSRQN